MKAMIIPGRYVPIECEDYYYETYNTFQSVWTEEFPRLGLTGLVSSNDFTRQDYIVSIFDNNVCAAFCCYREVDIRNRVHQEDSWFKEWDSQIFNGLKEQGFSKGLVFSYGTVHPEYRNRGKKAYNMFPLVGEVAMLYALSNDFELMFGATRNSHKVDNACRHWGSITIKEKVDYFNTNADLVIFTNPSVKEASKGFSSEGFDLFNNAIDFRYNKKPKIGGDYVYQPTL